MSNELHEALENICSDFGLFPEQLAKEAVDFAVQYAKDTIKAFTCMDCKANTLDLNEYYMVHDEVWEQAVPDRDGMLCAGCLCDRLGRKLLPEDFTDAPINDPASNEMSDRLLAMINGRVCEANDCGEVGT